MLRSALGFWPKLLPEMVSSFPPSFFHTGVYSQRECGCVSAATANSLLTFHHAGPSQKSAAGLRHMTAEVVSRSRVPTGCSEIGLLA